jgi:excisionase family DNA binding protein
MSRMVEAATRAPGCGGFDPRTNISEREIAEMLGVSRRTIGHWAARGIIPSYRLGTVGRYRREDVLRTLMGWAQPGSAHPLSVDRELLQRSMRDLEERGARSTVVTTRGVPFARVPLPERVKRVYVAGPSAEADRCERVMARVRAMGVTVTYAWTAGLPAQTDEIVSPACLAGVAAADVVIVLMPEVAHGPFGRPSPHVTIGAWVEEGAALALRKPVILVGPGSPVFAALCHTTATDDRALDVIAERAGAAR